MPPPRPSPDEDPLFAVRTATGVAVTIVLMDLLAVPVPMLFPLFSMSIISNQRGPFDLTRVVMTALLLPMLAYLATFLAMATRDMPMVFVLSFLTISFTGFHLLLVRANPMGLILIMLPGILSTMALVSNDALRAMRDTFVTIGIVLGLLIPALYLIFPGPTKPLPAPPPGPPPLRYPFTEILFRMLVYGPVLLGFYTGADTNSIIGLIIVAMVAGQADHHLRRGEARERITATVIGGAVGLVLVVLFSSQAHLVIEVCMVLLVGLWFCQRMMTGRLGFTTYQFGFSVALGIAISGLTTRDPVEAIVQRLTLTVGGALYAIVALALLEQALSAWERRAGHKRQGAASYA